MRSNAHRPKWKRTENVTKEPGLHGIRNKEPFVTLNVGLNVFNTTAHGETGRDCRSPEHARRVLPPKPQRSFRPNVWAAMNVKRSLASRGKRLLGFVV
jgi:hypothetical protein